MADALLSPAVGGTFWLASCALIGVSAKKIREENEPAKVPLTGILAAFVFAGQMINFSIPGTGSSGHLGGGLLLAILLGPWRAFLAITSVLFIQALIFADGGLLALGCNIFNMGFFPAFIAFPLIYKPLTLGTPSKQRQSTAILLTALVGTTAAAMGVVVETQLSGITELPFKTFAVLMLSIHTAIGIVEGLITVAVVQFVNRTLPEFGKEGPTFQWRSFLPLFLVIALGAGLVSWFASSHPDGLEWSIGAITKGNELSETETPVRHFLTTLQTKSAFLPDYSFRKTTEGFERIAGSVSGLFGSVVVMALAIVIGFFLRRRKAH